LTPKIIEYGWMDGSATLATREQEYKEILLLGFITCKTLNHKAVRSKLFNSVMTLMGVYMWAMYM
jgi:hypothetical protein